MISWSPEKLSEAVKKSLDSHRDEIGSYKFEVPPELIRQEEDWWYVPIRSDMSVEQKNVFYDVLNRIEDELEQEHDLQMMLVPVAPEDEE